MSILAAKLLTKLNRVIASVKTRFRRKRTVTVHVTVHSLPAELWAIVIGQLDPSDLAKCARVSRSFYDQCTEHLYRTVKVFPWLVDEKTRVPATNDPDFPLFERFSYHLATTALHPSFNPTLLSGKGGSELRSRFTYTKTLILFPHHRKSCAHLIPLHLPNLETLVVQPEPHGSGVYDTRLEVCLCDHFRSIFEEDRCAEDPPCHCPFIASTQPTRVIFGSMSESIAGDAIGLWPSSPVPPPSVKEIVVFFGYNTVDCMLHPSVHSSFGLLEQMPNSVDRLTIVLWSWLGGQESPGPDYERWVSSGRAGPDMISDVGEYLALACSGEAALVEVVGYESIRGGRTEQEIEQGIRDIRAELESILKEVGWEDKEAEQRAEDILFITGEEYLTRDEDEKMKKSREAVIAAVKGELEVFYDVD